MQDKDFDKLIHDSLSDMPSSSKIAEDAMWNAVSKSIISKPSFSFVSTKSIIAYTSIIISISAFLIYQSFKSEQIVVQPQNTKPIITIEQPTQKAIDSTLNIDSNCTKKGDCKTIKTKENKEKVIEKQVDIPVNNISEEQTSPSFEEIKPVVQPTLKPVVQPLKVTKQIQVTDTVITTKRIRKK